MSARLNLRRKPGMYILLGVLVMLVALLMLRQPDKTWAELIFGSLCMLGGLLSVAYINRLVFDESAGEIVHQRGVLLPFRSEHYARAKIRAVRVTEKTVRSGDGEKTTFPVHLNGIKGATVLNHGNPWFSRVVAEQIARRIDVPFVNRVYGDATTREPHELDLPLLDRWIRDNVRFERPSLYHGTDFRENEQPAVYELSFRAEMPKLKYLAALLLLLALPALAPVPFADIFHSTGYRIIALFFLLAATMVLAFVGRSKLTITAKAVSFRQGYFPLAARIPIPEIEEMIVARDGITLIGDTKAVWVHWGGSKRESDYLQAVVPYQIQRLARYSVNGEGE